MDALLALQSSLHCLAVFCSAIADCDNASSPTSAAHIAKVGFITHYLRETPPDATASRPQRRREETAALAAATCSQPLTGSALLFALCSYDVKNKERTALTRKTAAPQGAAVGSIAGRLLPRRQCAVSVEESASTAGSVVTEVSVGFAFSSSHSIGSGLRVSARESTSSMRETGRMSRPFLMLSLISTRSLAFSSGISTVFMPPREAASSFSFR